MGKIQVKKWKLLCGIMKREGVHSRENNCWKLFGISTFPSSGCGFWVEFGAEIFLCISQTPKRERKTFQSFWAKENKKLSKNSLHMVGSRFFSILWGKNAINKTLDPLCRLKIPSILEEFHSLIFVWSHLHTF